MITLDVNIYWRQLRQALDAERLTRNDPGLGMRNWLWETYACQLDLGREASQTLRFDNDASVTMFLLRFSQ
jgi:hypothetical protein